MKGASRNTSFVDNINHNDGAVDDPYLVAAARREHIELMTTLLDAGVRDPGNDTPLCSALIHDQPEVAKLLLAKGASLKDVCGRLGLRPLLMTKGAAMVRVLLDAGERPIASDAWMHAIDTPSRRQAVAVIEAHLSPTERYVLSRLHSR